MHDTRTTISVVIPAHNREATIATTLDSLVRQSHAGWEAIVVDDASSDGTAAVVEQYAARDPRFRLHRQAHGGVSAARNAGIALAREPWLFLLDADDWIVPTAFEALVRGMEESADEVSAVYGGYVRVDEQGREVPQRRPPHSVDLFPIFATTCAFAVHTCLIRTELVRSVGSFDETLVTCEDWDLWQRVARAGARFAAIPDFIAHYRMRPSSASVNGARMLEDGLKVIERGHGDDPRLTTVDPRHRNGIPAATKAATRAYFACYAAGLVMAAGGDARWMLSSLGPSAPVELDPRGVADTLFHAVANGRASAPEGWPTFPPEVSGRCREFLEALGTWACDSWLSFQTQRALERLVLGVSDGIRPRTVGTWHLVDVDCDADPPAPVAVDPAVRHLLCSVRAGSRELGDVELPVCDGWVPPRVLADGIAAQRAWELLRARLERDVYPALEIEHEGGSVRVSRSGEPLFEGDAPPADYPHDEWLHDGVGWAVMLQELWGRPAWRGDWFYAEDRPEPGAAPRVVADGDAPVPVELTAPLPLVSCREASAAIGVTLAGVPLVTLRLPTSGGRVAPHDIRRATLMRLGFELCRAIVREWILAPAGAAESPPSDQLAPPAVSVGQPGAAGPPLRDQLAAAAATRDVGGDPAPMWVEGCEPRPLVPGWSGGLAELLPPDRGATVIARRAVGAEGTGVSRYAVLPAAARAELLAGARGSGLGDPVLEVGPPGADRPLVYVPGVQWDRAAGGDPDGEDESILTQLHFEQTFAARPDPWGYESDYERRKYDQTLALVPGGVERALELGCAEGTFTVRLAERVGSLLACDISTVALSRAARRCNGRRNVTFTRLDLFHDELPRGYDLVACSEVLYYAGSRAQLDRALRSIARALRPGGVLLTANAHVLVDEQGAPGFDWDVPFGGKGIGEAVLASGLFDLDQEVRAAPYRIQSFRRRERRRFAPRRLARRGPTWETAEAGEMTLAAASRYFADGGRVRVEETEQEVVPEPRLPILMYHRVAADGSPRSERWRVHPEAFERQLTYLREGGYYSVSFEQWRAAANMRRPLPGRPIMLTFDDGYADFPDHVAPALRRHGFRATVFVVSELVGQTNVWDAALEETLPLMDWHAIEELAGAGIDVGSHSARHRPLVALDPKHLAEDLARSRRLLEERLGHAVTSVCYPFGLHDPAVTALAGACGYEFGVTTNEWPASWSDGLLVLPRLEVRGTHGLDDFVAMLPS